LNPCRVVVGIDFSSGSADAVREARRISHQIAGTLDLVHVATDGSAAWRGDPDAANWLARHEVQPESLMVRVGLPWVELARYASETQPAMIVVGSHGGSGFHPLGLGSTTARLGVVSPVPVLVVAPRARLGATMVAGASRTASVDQFRNESTGGAQ
jgi:nucleotide-binding universal stress UspA family protein